MKRRVLVPLDGSAAAETAVWHAVAVAGALAEGVLLVHVLETPVPSEPSVRDLDWRLMRAEARAYLLSVARRLEERGIDVSLSIDVGSAAEQIVRHARRDEIVLVVMAAHGRGESDAFSFGGTTHKVLSLSSTSVMVVRRGDDAGPLAPDLGYGSVLVPLDGSPASEWALGVATGLARYHRAAMLLLHLVPELPRAWEKLPPSAEESALQQQLDALRRERAERYLNAQKERLAHTGLEVRTHLAQAVHLAEGIRAAAEEHRTDLIALAAHGASAAPYPYGSVAQRLLAASGLPIIVFQDCPAAQREVIGRPGSTTGATDPLTEPAADASAG
jgi:nucleotide-binding universal stress UspA family protein